MVVTAPHSSTIARMRKVSALLVLVLLIFGCTKKDSAALQSKTLGYAFGADIKGFDPAIQNDEYSATAIRQVYEGLLQYHYLKRPYQLEPRLAASMPTVSKDGLTFTFKIRPNVFFQDHAVFGGKPRPLRASDVVYSYKRLADPHLRGPNWWVFEGRIKGLDAFRKKIKSLRSPIDYDAFDVEGLQAPDDQTFVLKLTRPYRQLLYVLAMSVTTIVPKELVQKYGDEFLNHAAGTGPFMLKEWRRGQKIRLLKNPNYWEHRYPTEGMPEDEKLGRLKAAGKRLPFLDEIVIWVYTESQPRWLNFLRGKIDLAGIPKEAFDQVFDDQGNLTEDIRKRKIALDRSLGADVIYMVFNMEDPLLGQNRYLRRAISSIINREEKIKLFYNNRAVVANGPIPPGMFGHDPEMKDPFGYNPKRAKALMKKALEEYQAKSGKKEFPPIRLESQTSTVSRQMAEATASELAQIGLKVETVVNTWPQFLERTTRKQAQFFGSAWRADYPDPENFLQLLYGKNESPGPNSANFKNKEYDRLYEEMRDLPDGPKRLALIKKMVNILHTENPWIFFNHRIGYGVRQAWLRNLKPNSISPGNFMYLDIDLEEKAKTLPLLR